MKKINVSLDEDLVRRIDDYADSISGVYKINNEHKHPFFENRVTKEKADRVRFSTNISLFLL